jgi:hypothetical protein
MNKYTSIIALFLIALSLNLSVISEADAKRFGGGGSFGGRSSYSAPYKRSAIPPLVLLINNKQPLKTRRLGKAWPIEVV